MANFIVVNESQYEVNNINVLYADEQSMDNQHADSDGVTVLSDSSIPAGTAVSEVNVEGVVITKEPTNIPVGPSDSVFAVLIYYYNPKSGQEDVVGMEVQQEEEDS